MDSLNIISYFSVVLVAEFYVIHNKKFTTSTIQIFFSVRYILCMALMSKKRTNIERGHHSHFMRQTDIKGTILALNDLFAQTDWGKFQGKHLFSQSNQNRY